MNFPFSPQPFHWEPGVVCPQTFEGTPGTLREYDGEKGCDGELYNYDRTGEPVKMVFFSEPNRKRIIQLCKQIDNRFWITNMSISSLDKWMWLFYNSDQGFKGCPDNGGVSVASHVARLNYNVAQELVERFRIGVWSHLHYLRDRFGPRDVSGGDHPMDRSTEGPAKMRDMTANTDISQRIFGPDTFAPVQYDWRDLLDR